MFVRAEQRHEHHVESFKTAIRRRLVVVAEEGDSLHVRCIMVQIRTSVFEGFDTTEARP